MSILLKERLWKAVSLRFCQHKFAVIKSWLTYDGFIINTLNPSETYIWHWNKLLSILNSIRTFTVNDVKALDFTLGSLTTTLELKQRYHTDDFLYLSGGAKTVKGSLINRFLSQWKEKFCKELLTNPHKNFENILDFIIINPFTSLNAAVAGILWNLARFNNKQSTAHLLIEKKKIFDQILDSQSRTIEQRYKIF